MELSQLEVFLAVAREHRFSRAAEKLYRTQSAVSQTIRKLEDELGEALFDRSSREGVLTDAGKVLFEYAEKLINLRSEAAESLTELRELQKGKLVIAANEFTVLYLLPLLAEFRRLHPMIKITVERALGSHIPDDVLRYSAEFGVLSYEPQEPSLHSVVVYLDELVFVVPPKHPLASAPQVSIRQLGAESFVAHIVSSPYREKVIQLFKTHKTPLHMDLELPTLQAIKQFVAMGHGVALVPEISVETELARGELVGIPVRELQLKRKLRLIYRKDANLSHAARAFLKVAEAVAARAQRTLPFPTRKLVVVTKAYDFGRPRLCHKRKRSKANLAPHRFRTSRFSSRRRPALRGTTPAPHPPKDEPPAPNPDSSDRAVPDQRIRARTLQARILSLCPGLQQRQFANAGAVHGTYPTQIEHQFARVLQDFAHDPRQRGRFIAIHDAALAVHDDHIALIARFQTEFQLQLLV